VVPKFSPPGGTLYPDPEGDPPSSYLKTGIYRERRIQGPATLYLDNWRIAPSFDDVRR